METEDRRKCPTKLLGAEYDGPLVKSQPETSGADCQYTYSTGSRYVGPMKDGMADGPGILYLPDGKIFRALWRKGKAVGFPRDLERFSDPSDPYADSLCYRDLSEQEQEDQDAVSGGRYLMTDGLEHRGTMWRYCDGVSDRRFYEEAKSGSLGIPGQTMMSAGPGPARDVPEGLYDCGDGLFDPQRRLVTGYEDGEYVRYVDQNESAWIVANCRQGEASLKVACRKLEVEKAMNAVRARE